MAEGNEKARESILERFGLDKETPADRELDTWLASDVGGRVMAVLFLLFVGGILIMAVLG